MLELVEAVNAMTLSTMATFVTTFIFAGFVLVTCVAIIAEAISKRK